MNTMGHEGRRAYGDVPYIPIRSELRHTQNQKPCVASAWPEIPFKLSREARRAAKRREAERPLRSDESVACAVLREDASQRHTRGEAITTQTGPHAHQRGDHEARSMRAWTLKPRSLKHTLVCRGIFRAPRTRTRGIRAAARDRETQILTYVRRGVGCSLQSCAPRCMLVH